MEILVGSDSSGLVETACARLTTHAHYAYHDTSPVCKWPHNKPTHTEKINK